MKSLLTLIILSSLSICTIAQIPTNGLVAYYPFNGNANDISGNNNNGTVNGATLTTDRNGNANSAYSFNGTSGYIDIPHSSSLSFTNNAISISFWAKILSVPTSGYSGIIISKQAGSGTTQQGFNVYVNTYQTAGLLLSNGGGNFGGAANYSVSTMQYHHFTYTYNNGVAYAYLDGVLTNSIIGQTATMGANTINLLIGKANWSNINAPNFNGIIDELLIYNRALNQTEVTQIYSGANFTQTYCTPTFSNSCSSGYISAVVFVDIANGSGCNGNTNNYISYPSSAFTTTVDINSTYNIDINCSTTGGIMGWIDYNQDGDFADAGEYILEDVGVAMYSGAITIPGNALNGQTTMRIIKNGGVVGSSNYCGNFVNGETEDYVITINGVSPTQNAICYSTPDGTDASNWSFKDYVIPSGFKIDSVYMNASRPGYSVQNYDFVFASCQGTTVFTPSLVTYPFSYGSVNTSLYNTWINLTSFSYTAVGMVRVSLPTNTGAIWNNLCFAISPISTNCAQNLSSGLVAKYDFSGNANDVSGNGHNGVVNGATLVADRFGNANKAYDFTNSTDKIVVSNSPSLSLTGNFGFNFWINIRSFNGSLNSIMSKMESGSCNHYGYFMGMMSWNGENKIEFQADPICSNANAYLPNNDGVLLTNQWYNIGITYNQSSSKLKYYKNGVIFDSIIQTLNIQNTTYDLIIGNHVTYPYTINSAGGNFDGAIDDIRIYNRELSPCEMDSLYIPAITTGIAENKSSNVNSLVYPNPASNALFINLKEHEVKSIEILNTVGQSLLYEKIDNANSKINIENLATGIYLYRIKLSSGSIQTGKFIIER